MKTQAVIIACPNGCVSGGPELAHQLCHVLNNHHINSYMYYYLENGDYVESETPAAYTHYNTKLFTHENANLLTLRDTAFVTPEVAIPLGVRFNTICQVYYWWMSVDNYIDVSQKDVNSPDILDCYQLCSDKNAIHMVQSAYARHFLLQDMHIPEPQIVYLSDYINDTFFETKIPAAFKQDFIAYNPVKGYQQLKPIIDKTPGLHWFPIVKMTANDVANLLRLSKLYIDFGSHPGKDRIPREAAVSGCCIITNRKGSAGYYEDVSIPDNYKFDDPLADADKVIDMIYDILQNYAVHSDNFITYREKIKQEKSAFEQNALAIFQADQ